MKRLVSAIMISLTLAACGSSGSSSSTQAAACSQQFSNGTIALCLPENWKIINEEDLRAQGVPSEAIVAFQAQEAVSGQLPTAMLTREALAEKLTTSEYSQANIQAVSLYPEYKLLDKASATVNGETTQLHVFSAQPMSDEPQRRYYQVSAVYQNQGYTLTIVTPVSISTALDKTVRAIAKSLAFEASK